MYAIRSYYEILDGPEDAATRYFEGKMTPELVRTLRRLRLRHVSFSGE